MKVVVLINTFEELKPAPNGIIFTTEKEGRANDMAAIWNMKA